MLAIAVATIVMHAQGQISLFREFAAYNLAAMAWYTMCWSILVENHVGGGRKELKIPVGKRTRSSERITYHTHCPVMTFIVRSHLDKAIPFAWACYIGLKLLIDECDPGGDLPQIGPSEVKWWLLGAHIKISGAVWLPFVLWLAPTISWWGMFFAVMRMKQRFPFTSSMWWALPTIVTTLLHILCIEMSLKINQAHSASDNAWGYGQVRISRVIILQWYSTDPGCVGHKDRPNHSPTIYLRVFNGRYQAYRSI
jgi:hypothetical protein